MTDRLEHIERLQRDLYTIAGMADAGYLSYDDNELRELLRTIRNKARNAVSMARELYREHATDQA